MKKRYKAPYFISGEDLLLENMAYTIGGSLDRNLIKGKDLMIYNILNDFMNLKGIRMVLRNYDSKYTKSPRSYPSLDFKILGDVSHDEMNELMDDFCDFYDKKLENNIEKMIKGSVLSVYEQRHNGFPDDSYYDAYHIDAINPSTRIRLFLE